jgi:hypothetical protein
MDNHPHEEHHSAYVGDIHNLLSLLTPLLVAVSMRGLP